MLSMQEGCIMLFTYYSFFVVLPERKRSVEPCKRENNISTACLQDYNTRYSLKKSAAFQTSKTTFYRPHTQSFELTSISKYQLLLQEL